VKSAVTAALAFAALILAAGCAQDGGGGSDAGRDGGRDAGAGDGGCQGPSDCSKADTLTAICNAGSCQDLPKDKSRITYVKLSFSTTGAELFGKTASFTYFAVHPVSVSGGSVKCSQLLSASVDPMSGEYNVIQRYSLPLVTDAHQDMMTSTLDMPNVTGLVLLLHILDSGNKLIGMGCEGNIDMPITPPDKTVGVYICPVDKLGACISSGS
jgi:hypothetical protein